MICRILELRQGLFLNMELADPGGPRGQQWLPGPILLPLPQS